MRRMGFLAAVLAMLAVLLAPMGVFGLAEDGTQGELDVLEDSFDMDAQLDALGRDELLREAPEEARELMEDADLEELSVQKLLQLSPGDFFGTLWELLVQEVKKPARTLGVVVAVLILCAMLSGMRTAVSENSMTGMFTTVAVLGTLTTVMTPILDCIIATSTAVRDAATFMLTFIPMLAAAMTAAGQPVTGAAYNTFLFSTCQVVAQVIAQTLIPLMGIYLAFCVVGATAPEMRIASATKAVKSIVTWTLGLLVTVFVGLLSIQTMVTGGADGVTTRAAKFVIGSFVPVVGGALSDAYTAAQGCLRLIKTSVGAYGILVAVFTFLPALLQTVLWYLVTAAAAIAGDVLGVEKVSEVLRSCSTALGILMAVLLSFALLIIVSTTVVMVAGLGA